MSDLTRAPQRFRVAEREAPRSGRAGDTAATGHRPAQPFGNQAALRALGDRIIQPKLRVNSPGDDFEREADAAAAAVMRAPGHASPTAEAARLSQVGSAVTAHRKKDGDDLDDSEKKKDDDLVQAKGGANLASEVPSDVESSIASTRGGGSALPPVARQYFEPRFGRDLSSVRVHDDAGAANAARQLDAHAFTTGSDIYFGSGRYQPASSEGRSLLAHELAHTIQQQPGAAAAAAPMIARQAVTDGPAATTTATPTASTTTNGSATATAEPGATGTAGPTGTATTAATAGPLGAGTGAPISPTQPKLPADVPAEETEMMGAGTFTPSAPVAEYIKGKGRAGGPVRVRFGSLAAGAINVAETKEGYQTPGGGSKLQSVGLTHPFVEPLRQRGIAEPVLAVRMKKSEITGYLTIASAKGVPLDYQAIGDVIEKHADALGWLGLDDIRLPNITNKLESGTLTLKVPKFSFRVGGFLRGSGEVGLVNETVTFAASADVKIKKGVAEAKFNVERDKTGLLYGKAQVPVTFANFSGNFIVELGNGTFRFDGLVKYTSEKFTGEVKLIVTDEQEARNIARTKLPPDKILASAEEAKGKPAEKKGPKPGPRAVAGWGTLTFNFTNWLAGQATVIIDSEGHITVVGEITPPAEVELFKQRDYIKPLPKFEARATYGIPVVGNLFVFANIGFEALAKLGPGKIYKIRIAGTYSTDPEVLQDFSIEATLNISAFAGLRVRAEGGAGIEILSHDIKAGVGLNALAGVRGYVEATPKVGYREKADPELGKKGEAYLHGHMEIAAQPFLGLSGDLFVEISTPWWSPLSDHKWTWPIGNLEYPLPGEFGIGADVDYLIGSDQLPDIQFGEVDFSADKFMTDLMNDHVEPKKTGEQEKQGEWKEGTEGGGEKDPAAVDSQGKPPEGEAASGQQAPGEKTDRSPEKQEQYALGMQAIGELAEQSQSEPFTQEHLQQALAAIKSKYGFSSLRPQSENEDWRVFASMSAEQESPAVIQGLEEEEEADDSALYEDELAEQWSAVEATLFSDTTTAAIVSGNAPPVQLDSESVRWNKTVLRLFLEDNLDPGSVLDDAIE
ncbi:MAG TPA: DUF4157 domain-containing protein, partial [Thermoanaerobaculia bacterium]|nr:DUF4157 domain-containing protein [Thermoanaerobaculia bacterium]